MKKKLKKEKKDDLLRQEDIYLEEDEQMPPRGIIWIENGVWFQTRGRLRVRGNDGKDWIIGFAVGRNANEMICRNYWQKPEFYDPPDPATSSPFGYFKTRKCKFGKNLIVEYITFEDEKEFWEEKRKQNTY